MKSRIFTRLGIVLLFSFVGLYVLSMTSSRPDNLGVSNGRLAKCPDKPNCVSTQATDDLHRMDSVAFTGSTAEIIGRIKDVVGENFSRTKLISESDNYLHFEFTSLIFRFVDDVEFMVDDSNMVVHFRSASRVGHSDMDANRNRMKKIIERLSE